MQAVIAGNLQRVQERIARAAERSGRQPGDVRLVAVTKYVGPREAAAVVAAGCHDLGESRPQDLWSKAEALQALPVRWHLIGHLQRNKIRRTLPHVGLLHSADSRPMLAALDRVAGELQRVVDVLLEVNISRDHAKHGFLAEQLEPLLPELSTYRQLRFLGLMAMSGLGSAPAAAQRQFQQVRQLRDQLRAVCPPEVRLDELSMGMSGDFEQAIAEGATLVRIGSALFEGLA